MFYRAILGLVLVSCLTPTLDAGTWWAEMRCHCDGGVFDYKTPAEHDDLQQAIDAAVAQLEAGCADFACDNLELLDYDSVPRTSVPMARISAAPACPVCPVYKVRIWYCSNGRLIKFDHAPKTPCCCEAKRQVQHLLYGLRQSGVCPNCCVMVDCCVKQPRKRRGLFGRRR